MTTNLVADEQLGAFARRQRELSRLVRYSVPKSGPYPIVDCDALPRIQHGWVIEEHQRGGEISLDPKKLELHHSLYLTGDKSVSDQYMREELEGKMILNACVLDRLLANVSLIPEFWREDDEGHIGGIRFRGTTYRRPNGNLYHRNLLLIEGRWCSGYVPCEDDRPSAYFAVISVG